MLFSNGKLVIKINHLITLRESLKGKSIPVETIFHLPDNVTIPSKAKGYIPIIKDAFIKRQLMYFTHEINENIENGLQAEKILSLMVDKGFELSKPVEDNIKPLKAIIKKSINQIEAAHDNKGVVGLKTDLRLDSVLHGLKPKLYVLAGRPGTGDRHRGAAPRGESVRLQGRKREAPIKTQEDTQKLTAPHPCSENPVCPPVARLKR